MSYEPNSPATSRSSRTRNSSRQRDTLSNFLLKTLVSNYTVTDGSLTVTLRSPFDLLAQGGKSKDWWS
jgi:hypothetical protein